MAAKLFELAGKRVFVAGHNGMVGSAIVRRLKAVPCEVITAARDEVDLERQDQAEAFLAARRPEVVIVAAAKVGGIHANDAYPAEFISENIAIARNTIHASYLAEVSKLLFLGSSCIYPKLAYLSPCARRSSSRDRSSRAMNGMRSPRSPASNCAKRIGANTAPISSR